jgi:hypothetical protein
MCRTGYRQAFPHKLAWLLHRLRCFSNQPEDEMSRKVLIAAAVAALMAAPLAQAAGDKAKEASADKSKAASASQGATKNDGGAAAMFKNMDKNKDGSISRAEAKGTPHEKDFAKLDKNSDGKLSAQEHAAAPEHAGKAAAGGTSMDKDKAKAPASGSTGGDTKKKY